MNLLVRLAELQANHEVPPPEPEEEIEISSWYGPLPEGAIPHMVVAGETPVQDGWECPNPESDDPDDWRWYPQDYERSLPCTTMLEFLVAIEKSTMEITCIHWRETPFTDGSASFGWVKTGYVYTGDVCVGLIYAKETSDGS